MLKYVEQCNGNIADIITACIRLELCQSELFVACCWKKLHDPVCPISPGTVILVLSSSVLSGLYFHGLLQVRRGHQSSSKEESSGIASAAFFTGRHPARCSSCHNQQRQSTEALTILHTTRVIVVIVVCCVFVSICRVGSQLRLSITLILLRFLSLPGRTWTKFVLSIKTLIHSPVLLLCNEKFRLQHF